MRLKVSPSPTLDTPMKGRTTIDLVAQREVAQLDYHPMTSASVEKRYFGHGLEREFENRHGNSTGATCCETCDVHALGTLRLTT